MYKLKSYQDYIDTISEYIIKNRLDVASSLCIEALFNFPESFSFNYYLAFIAYRNGQTDNAKLYGNIAIELFRKGRTYDYELLYLNDLGVVFLALKEYKLAEECIVAFLKYKPEDYTGMYNMGVIFFQNYQYDKSLEWLLKVKKINPTYDLLVQISKILCIQHKLDLAEQYCRMAIAIEPNIWIPYHNIGGIMLERGNSEEAVKYLKKAIKLFPGSDTSYYSISEIGIFIKNASNSNKLITNVKKCLSKGGLEKPVIANFNYALGNAYHAQRKYNQAFACYKLANEEKDSASVFNITKYRDGFQRYRDIFTKDFFTKKESYGNPSLLLAFIVGTPRSGTSLVEHILTCHSKISSCGETTRIGNISDLLAERDIKGTHVTYPETALYCSKEEVRAWAGEYLKKTQSECGNAERIFDKMPENAFNIGFIKLLFPKSIIINCKRHPLDVILSMYCTNFSNSNFANRLNIISEYYKYYSGIMKHWHSVFPGQIYDNYYEELVYRQYEKSHELIEFCQVEWEDSCLKFYENEKPVYTASKLQVRQPMYANSIFRWKNYESHLSEVREVLKDEICEYESEIIRRVPELAKKL